MSDLPKMAFPHEWTSVTGVPMGYHGMTLRDYFAAHALAALVTATSDVMVNNENLAKDAYKIADAMMKLRGDNND